ncbi:MAG: M20/M25/M40 family metallo-hydrolase [Planctomycetota bacterium]
MKRKARLVGEAEAVRTVMKLLRIGGTSGREGRVARAIAAELAKAGVPRKLIRHDSADRKVAFDAECGNLIAHVPGRGALAGGAPRLFCAHMDTVTLAAGARPVRKGGRVVAAGETALGADDRAGCACVLTMVKTLARRKLGHAPLVLLFTMAEETGLWGARYVDAKPLRKCAMGFSYDGGDPAELVVAAPSSDKFTLTITGRASHAGVHPERGVSAATVFADATARLSTAGWLGKVKKGRERGTSNIGVVEGGLATNIVMPALTARGEARSYSAKFLDRILDTIRREFERAAKRAKNSEGKRAKTSFSREAIYRAFDLGDDAPVVSEAAGAAEALGLKPVFKRQFGGLDANWLNAHGVPTVTLGAGASGPHAVGERLDLKQYAIGCEMAVRLAGAQAGSLRQ